jgi:hypothetical protein
MDPSGDESVRRFMAAMMDEGIRYPSGSSMNVSDRPELVRREDRVAFARATGIPPSWPTMSATGITTAVDRDASDAPDSDEIPQPIITRGHSVTVAGVLAALLLRQPPLTALLAAVLAPAVLLGPRASLYRRLRTRLFPRQNAAARAAGRVEDRRLVRFNNTLALSLLLLAQGAFQLGAPVVGWAMALTLGAVAGIALAGFCLGCFLSYQLGLQRSRLPGSR